MATLTSPSIAELIQDVRYMLGQPDANNSNWSDEQLLTWLNEGVRRYFVEVIQHGEGHFTTQVDLDLTANVETVPLPTDCFSVKVLYRKVSGGFVALAYKNDLINGFSTTASASGDLYAPYYRFQGNNIQLRPLPGATEAGGLRLEYVQFPDNMVSGGDTMTSQIAPVFKDLIETYAVWKAKVQESLVSGTGTYTAIQQNLADLYSSFQQVIAARSAYPASVTAFHPESD